MLKFKDIFKSKGRYFKVDGMYLKDEEIIWSIVEVIQRNDCDTVLFDAVSSPFERGRKEMNEALKAGRIEII